MNTIELLEKTKLNVISALNDYFSEYPNDDPFSNHVEVSMVPDSLYQESRIIIKALSKKLDINMPTFIKGCRTIKETIDCLTSDMGINDNENTLKSYVTTSFNEYIDYLEDEQIDVKIIHVECETPDHLTYSHILEDINKIEKRFNEKDYSGAITSARSLVEGVCNEIVNNLTGSDLEDKLDLPALFTLVRKQLNLDNKNPNLEKPLKQVISGLVNIVNGLAQIRNENGDAHHRRYDVNKHHALVVINSAKTVVTFLFNTYEYQLNKGTLVKV